MRREPIARLLGLGRRLPDAISNDELAHTLGTTTAELLSTTGIAQRHHAAAGQGPSDLALAAAHDALAAARTGVADLGLIVFATATPDVTFPGAACYLQHKLGAPTVGALDVRAQSAGFLCALDLAACFTSVPASGGGPDARYARVLIAAGEVSSSGLDYSPAGRDMTSRLADGAGAAVVGRDGPGASLHAVRWYSDGALADRFWCEFPASYQYPLRVRAEDLAAGKHYPKADLDSLAGVVPAKIAAVAQEALDGTGWCAADVDLAIVDFVVPDVARAAVAALGIAADRTVVPTAEFGHVMAGGLAISLADAAGSLAPGARVLLAAAGSGLAWGAATIEI